ncbi:hypothetical protein D3C78_1445260 [compost metagenome]
MAKPIDGRGAPFATLAKGLFGLFGVRLGYGQPVVCFAQRLAAHLNVLLGLPAFGARGGQFALQFLHLLANRLA